MTVLSELLIERRRQLNLTQAEVSRETEIDQSHISRIESGEHQPNHYTLGRLCEFYRIDVQSILNGQLMAFDERRFTTEEILLIHCLRNGELERVMEIVMRVIKRKR